MLKVLSVFGTRPEAIKMAPVVHALQRRAGEVESVVCVTAQHREMLDSVLDIFEVTPDYDLDLMRPGQLLSDLTSRVLLETTAVLRRERPDVVLVQGDTTTAAATALAAFYERIPVGHVEAGLRTNDPHSPFPEEMNRRLVGLTADYHFPPTRTAEEALLGEGIARDRIFLTGNTVVDALYHVVNTTEPPPLPFDAAGRRIILVTAHRRENFGAPLEAICRAIRQLAADFPDVEIVYPVHPNPNVVSTVRTFLDGVGGVHLLPPQDYVAFTHLLARAHLVLTDSGGVQEEAPALGKPTLVLRNETERPEGVTAGVAKLVGPDERRIVREATRLLTSDSAYAAMARGQSLYGDGTAAQRIVDTLLAQVPAAVRPERRTDLPAPVAIRPALVPALAAGE